MEPERPVEGWLREYAKKRRAEADASGIQLHPATRRLLQSEVARRPQPESPRPWTPTKTTWLQILGATCGLVILLAGVFTAVQPSGGGGMFTGNEPLDPATGLPVTPASTPESRPIALAENGPVPEASPTHSYSFAPHELTSESNPSNEPASPPTPAGQSALIAAAENSAGNRVFDKEELQQEKTVGSEAAQPQIAWSQNYSQTPSSADEQYRKAAIATPVLASFKLQQNDHELQVVDQDGSVYNGTWRPQYASADLVRKAAGPSNASLESAGMITLREKDLPPQNYYFSVTGLNNSLKQMVVFSGNLLPLTNSVALTQSNVIGNSGGALGSPSASRNLQSPLSSCRVSGTATIDDRKTIEINATPSP